jgi:hypothetical protein
MGQSAGFISSSTGPEKPRSASSASRGGFAVSADTGVIDASWTARLPSGRFLRQGSAARRKVTNFDAGQSLPLSWTRPVRIPA